ncbi:MAG: hypothetical protein O3A55_06655 [Bacteroidetes bacterium]|nr:hypothetical protein [Bacteroidota bacterium]
MTTVPPPKVKEFNPETLEKIAYKSVSTIPTREKNDQFRLGYCIWLFLSEKKGTLKQAVQNSGARVLISEPDVIKIISDDLKNSGINL